MIELELTIKTESPLALRARRTGAQFTSTLTHVPGTTLRGALALDYLRRGGQPEDDLFQTLFLGGQVSFGPLFPGQEEASGKPLPLSAMDCKRYGAKHAGSVGDSLLRLELADLLESLTPLQDWEECPDCKTLYPDHSPNKREPLTGYYLNGASLERVTLDKRMLTGVGISRTTGTAAQGILFSLEAIEEGHYFGGRIRFYGDHAAKWAKQLEAQAPPGSILRLGAARSRGTGRVRVVRWRPASPARPSIAKRWDSLNAIVRRLWEQYDAEPEGEYFTLTMASPLVLRDACLRPLRADELDAGALGLPTGTERRRVVLGQTVLQGWNAAWRLPKEDTPAFETGSVLLFRVPAGQRDVVLPYLEEIERRGWGERRVEGCGRITVCDPFHYRWEEERK